MNRETIEILNPAECTGCGACDNCCPVDAIKMQPGATTLFVSHSLMQVKRLSNKVLWLHKGEQIAFGPTAEICPKYEKFLKDGILPERTATEET